MQATSLPQASPAMPSPNSISKRAGKYLIFRLGPEEFGTEVLKVREIMGLQDITAIPQVPAYVKLDSAKFDPSFKRPFVLNPKGYLGGCSGR